MELIINIPEEVYEKQNFTQYFGAWSAKLQETIESGVVIPDDATNGDMIKAMFGADKVFGFIHYVHLMAKMGNWFNEGVVAEFDKEWWDAPYKGVEE